MEIIIKTDGGSRGNPGPAAIGAIVEYGSEKKKYGECIGKKTNNEAEYQAVVFALKKAKQLIGKKKAKNEAKVKCVGDSQLLVKQLNHEYKIQDEKIQKLFIQTWNLTLDFLEVKFEHVKRELNKEADALVNEALDKECSKMKF